ncbi:cytochrome b ascorbate-dependent protein 3 isoform X2 [Esox lucius]|uniref:cytochrome b ascorbate-dependent protein 3 isoform X2 n=1 Tax=Esox lucius TaxID=8010 RepID=UPI001476B5E0|nr:cytochrome b ascorbate-dependent protein 3 isoform X2 [Esox lucius]
MHDYPPTPKCSTLSECLPLSQWNETGELGSEMAVNTMKQELKSKSSLADCSSRMRSIVSFYFCYLLCLCLGIACIVLVTTWNSKWRGGFAWDGSSLQFNWHPVLMVTGLVVLYGNGAVLYRVPLTWGQNKLPWKLLHAGVMLLALICSVLGLCAVFDFHNANKTQNLYSLHSWIGICTTALFTLQWVLGLAGFLLPCSPMSFRKLLKPAHVWMGGSILILSVVSCISGINEKLFFALKGTTNGTQPYANLPPEALVANSFGVLIVLFGLVILKILSNPHWQRQEASEDPLLQDDN